MCSEFVGVAVIVEAVVGVVVAVGVVAVVAAVVVVVVVVGSITSSRSSRSSSSSSSHVFALPLPRRMEHKIRVAVVEIVAPAVFARMERLARNRTQTCVTCLRMVVVVAKVWSWRGLAGRSSSIIPAASSSRAHVNAHHGQEIETPKPSGMMLVPLYFRALSVFGCWLPQVLVGGGKSRVGRSLQSQNEADH